MKCFILPSSATVRNLNLPFPLVALITFGPAAVYSWSLKFSRQTYVEMVKIPGSVKYDSEKEIYTIRGMVQTFGSKRTFSISSERKSKEIFS